MMMCAHGLTVPVHSFCQGQPAADAVKWISSYLPAEAEKRAISRCGMASRTGSRPPSARRVLTLPAPFKPEDCTIALAIRPAPNPPDLTLAQNGDAGSSLRPSTFPGALGCRSVKCSEPRAGYARHAQGIDALGRAMAVQVAGGDACQPL